MAYPQDIYVSVDATPEDLVGYFLSEEGRRAVAATSAAARQKVTDDALVNKARKVTEKSAPGCLLTVT